MVALLRLGDRSDDGCSRLPGDPGYPEKRFRLRHLGRVDVTDARRGHHFGVATDGLGWCFFVVTGVVDGRSVTVGPVVGGVVTVTTGGLVVGVVVVVVVVVKLVTTGGGAIVPCVLSGAVLTATTVPVSTGGGLRVPLVGPGTLAAGAEEGAVVVGEPLGAVAGVVVGAGSGIVVKLVVLWLDGPGVPW